MGFRGDPEALVEGAIEKILEEYKNYVENVYRDALDMLDDGYSKIRTELEEKLEEIIARYREEVSSREASRESELSLYLHSLKKKLLDEVMVEAMERLRALPEDERRRILTTLLDSFLLNEDVAGGVIHVLQRDASLMTSILEEKGLADSYEINVDLKAKLGGFKVSIPGENIVYDYTLDFLFENMKDKLYSIAYKTVFGSQK